MALVTNIIFKNILNKICQVFIVSSLLVTASYGENIFDPGNFYKMKNNIAILSDTKYKFCNCTSKHFNNLIIIFQITVPVKQVPFQLMLAFMETQYTK